jgi:protein phosphatase
LVGLAVIVVVVGALAGTYAWTQTQYFVGEAGADVAIYRGVNTEFGPLKFFTVYRVTNLPVANLQDSYRGQVEDGITAHSKKEAQGIVDSLRKQQLPGCLASSSPSAPSAPASPSTGAPGTASSVVSAPASRSVAPCPVPTP